jgi:NAD(P)H-flavin reductase
MQSLFHYVVTNITHLTPTHLQLMIHPLKTSLDYTAGQYLQVQYPNGDFLPFSIANAPRNDGTIELHLRVSETDLPTQQFINQIIASPIITVRGPFGECQYRAGQSPIILLAAGTGFAPAKAILEKIAATQIDRECYLFWTVKKAADFYLPELPNYWQEKLSHFHFVPIITQDENKQNILESVNDMFIDFSKHQLYVFGPYSLARDAFNLCSAKGLQKQNFHTDMMPRDDISHIP